MSTEISKAAVPDFNAAFNAGELDEVEKLTTKDTDWASTVLERAFYSDPLLNFIYLNFAQTNGNVRGRE